MKKIIEKFKRFTKGKILQIVISIITTAVGVVIAILNLTGIFNHTDHDLLNLVIILLCGLNAIYIIEEIDDSEEIKMHVMGLPDKVNEMEGKISQGQEKNFTELQNEIKNVQSKLLEVHNLVEDTHTTKGVVAKRKELERKRSLEEVWNNADEVCLLAIANTSFLRGNGISKIQEAVGKGIKFKLVALNPDYEAIKEYEESGIISPTSLPLGDNINTYKNICKGNNNGRNGKKKANEFKTMVEFRITTYLLPYSMMIVKRNGKIDTIKVDLYGVDIEYTDRRSFYIPAEDEENIKFYEEQWNTIWENRDKTIKVEVE